MTSEVFFSLTKGGTGMTAWCETQLVKLLKGGTVGNIAIHCIESIEMSAGCTLYSAAVWSSHWAPASPWLSNTTLPTYKTGQTSECHDPLQA